MFKFLFSHTPFSPCSQVDRNMLRSIVFALCSIPTFGLASNAIAETQLPATIQAENFDSQHGVRTSRTNDVGGGDFVGWIQNGDYTEYDVIVPSAGIYKLQLRVSGKDRTTTINLKTDGRTISNAAVTPTGSFSTWKTVSTTLPLSSGRQTLQFEFNGSSGYLIDMNWFSLALVGDDIPTTSDRQLDRSNWMVYAGNNSDNAYLAIDGNAGSRWSTRTRQANGQEFYVNLGANQEFDRIVLDTTQSSNDYPRSYEVDVSTNGSNWTTVAQGAGNASGPTTIDFNDQNASFVRITQLGSSDRFWWSIHEINLYSDSVVGTTPTLETLASEAPTPVSPVDGNCPGDDIQACIDNMSSGSLVLGAKTYKLSDSLRLKSNVNILGQGAGTVITWLDSVADSVNKPLFHTPRGRDELTNIRLEDFTILCTVDITDRNDDDRTDARGIYIDGGGNSGVPSSLPHSDLTLKRLKIHECGGEGIHIKGINGFVAEDLNLFNNGWGHTDLWHNLYLLRGYDIVIRQTSNNSGGFKNSPSGHGLRMHDLRNVYWENLTVTGNADHGIHMTDVEDVRGYNLDVGGNCAIANGTCRDVACYLDCDYDLSVNKE